MRAILGWGAFAALTLVGLDAAAQCLKDTDCKLNRVCLEGRCVEVAPGTPTRTAPGYQTPGYQQPAPAYQQPAPAYQQPAPVYQQPAPVYQQPAPAYQQPAPVYQQPAPAYQRPAPAYQQPAPVYQQPAPVYQQPAPVYQQPAPAYQPAPGYPPTAYGAPYAPAAPAGPLQWYQTFYGNLGGIFGFHGWGGESYAGQNPSVSGQFKGGISMSGYAVLTPNIHLGGYFDYTGGHLKSTVYGYSSSADFDHYSFGVSLKAGQRMAERIWLGFVGDLGLYALDPTSGGDTWYGVQISPRIHVDVLAFDFGVPKMSFFASLGPSIVPYAEVSSGGTDASAYMIYIQMYMGVTFGF
jgi:hypothetical protein